MENIKVENISLQKKILFSIISAFILTTSLLILLEGALFLFGYNNIHDLMQIYSVEKAKWWINDSIAGPRYVSNQIDKSDKLLFPAWLYERLQIINNEGYHDKDDFVELPSDTNSIKILFVGDSYTWGYSSDVDSSYVDIFEQKFNSEFPCIVWNTAVTATGTNHALFTTKKFLPMQKSDLVILGFFENDFEDNIFPYDRLFFAKNASCFRGYELDNTFNPTKISIRTAYKIATGSFPDKELSYFERNIIIKSRLVHLFNSAFKKIKRKMNKKSSEQYKSRLEEYKFNTTKLYLNKLKDYVKENNAELFVLLIPSENDTERKSNNYLAALEILKELDINFLELSDKLSKNEYMHSTNDGHWNNSGHYIAGTLLAECILNWLNDEKKSY